MLPMELVPRDSMFQYDLRHAAIVARFAHELYERLVGIAAQYNGRIQIAQSGVNELYINRTGSCSLAYGYDEYLSFDRTHAMKAACEGGEIMEERHVRILLDLAWRRLRGQEVGGDLKIELF